MHCARNLVEVFWGKFKMKVLVLGVSGMLGNAIFRFLSDGGDISVKGTVRTDRIKRYIAEPLHSSIISGVDVTNLDNLVTVFAKSRPDVVINCIGLVKQLSASDDPLEAIPINSLLPHRLAQLCSAMDARLVHMSTDCVFSGSKGMYRESDIPDATDLYGRSKFLGEVDYLNAITLRTSIIGHELDGARSLICWFLAQNHPVKGFKQAIFSGLPTVEIARIIRDFILPNTSLQGVYHVSADPISKYDLLHFVAQSYGKEIKIIEDTTVAIDRSLDSSRFRSTTGFKPKKWPELVRLMREFG